ncbi:hypothetical protein DXG03_002397 [Asterophora parasitica]|uniref:chitinase n=1 Tax=Asterophora parasitica TaxID=117018 RepID=A0A9P7GCB4_9AGAR|nr:hypothetical protein DXG03_002397 [Asterophora parasitica]
MHFGTFQDNAIDVFPVAFLNVFFGTGGLPSINLANICNPTDNATFPGTNLPNCASLASDIATCQGKGKIVTLSLGGATASAGFQSDSQASAFAQTIWDLFLGGSSSTRPFGNAVLDGVDLDIEGGSNNYYATFVNKIRSLSNGASKKFYNNQCGLQSYGSGNFNFGTWDYWARNISPNKNVKIYLGAPASSSAAGGGYTPIDTLKTIAVQLRKSFSSFGGVMLWDASQAWVNNRFDLAIKNALVAAGGTGFTFPACTAPAFVPGKAYSAGDKTTYNGYIWQVRFINAFCVERGLSGTLIRLNGTPRIRHQSRPMSGVPSALVPAAARLPRTLDQAETVEELLLGQTPPFTPGVLKSCTALVCGLLNGGRKERLLEVRAQLLLIIASFS